MYNLARAHNTHIYPTLLFAGEVHRDSVPHTEQKKCTLLKYYVLLAHSKQAQVSEANCAERAAHTEKKVKQVTILPI